MSEENKTIHDFDINLICEYFMGLERQGPGSPDTTVRALSFVDNLTRESRIADLGCGTGGQTMVLAQNAPGDITGIDLFPAFIDIFKANAVKLGLGSRVRGVTGSMDNLPFQEGELDLIWSEGAIYNIGFERGLNEWRKFLKPGGYIAVTENTWFSEERPTEIQDFWQSIYPEIDTIPNKVAQMQKAGYLPVATYMLPESIWTDYYSWQTKRRESFLKKYEGNNSIKEFVATMQYEAELYDKYKAYYGYMFYIGKKM